MKTKTMTETQIEKIAGILGEICGVFLVSAAVTALEAWLLVLVLGWFGVTVLTFWKAVVVIILIDLILKNTKTKK